MHILLESFWNSKVNKWTHVKLIQNFIQSQYFFDKNSLKSLTWKLSVRRCLMVFCSTWNFVHKSLTPLCLFYHHGTCNQLLQNQNVITIFNGAHRLFTLQKTLLLYRVLFFYFCYILKFTYLRNFTSIYSNMKFITRQYSVVES